MILSSTFLESLNYISGSGVLARHLTKKTIELRSSMREMPLKNDYGTAKKNSRRPDGCLMTDLI